MLTTWSALLDNLMVFVMNIFWFLPEMLLAQTFIDVDEELNLTGLLQWTCFIRAIRAIQGHQHKKVYSPACVNEILCLISNILLLNPWFLACKIKLAYSGSFILSFAVAS